MGLDVGVVRIEYLDRPQGVGYEFLWQLAIDADKADWEVSSGPNTFIELTREHMMNQAQKFVAAKKLGQNDREVIQKWINSLPWRGDTIMLHLGW